MGRNPSTFKQRDVTKAVKAVTAAGIQIARVEVDKDGRIVVVAGKPTSDSTSANPWDQVVEELAGADN